MPTTLLQANQLSHRFGQFQALEPLDLTLNSGEITILEGHNGSGKSTLLLCLSGLLRPSSGEILIEGKDYFTDEISARRALAIAPDVPRFYIELTAWEHLMFIASAHNALDGFEPRAEKLLRDFGLWEARDLYPHLFSRGMSLKLGLLMALIRPFKVLLLDEPTSALDPASTQLLVERLIHLRQNGASILFTSHDPDLKTNIGDHVFQMNSGKLTKV